MSSPLKMPNVTDRDVKALRAIYHFKFCTIEQARLAVYKNRNVAQRRLAALELTGLLRSFAASNGDQGHPTKVFFLNQRRFNVLTELFNEDVFRRAIPKEAPANVTANLHLLDLNTVLAHFIAACNEAGLGLELVPEYMVTGYGQSAKSLLLDEVKDPDNRRKTVKYCRDAVLCIESPKASGLFEVEYDRGKETILSTTNRKITVVRKVAIFLESLRAKRFQRFAKPAFFGRSFGASRLLIITTSQRRVSNILEACSTLDTHGLVYITTIGELTRIGPLGGIWTVPDQGQLTTKALVTGHGL